MGLFNLFRKSNRESSTDQVADSIDVSRDLFIEDKNPEDQEPYFKSNGEVKGIESVYEFLQADYEKKGYDDALTNPDDSYKSDNINLLIMRIGCLDSLSPTISFIAPIILCTT